MYNILFHITFKFKNFMTRIKWWIFETSKEFQKSIYVSRSITFLLFNVCLLRVFFTCVFTCVCLKFCYIFLLKNFPGHNITCHNLIIFQIKILLYWFAKCILKSTNIIPIKLICTDDYFLQLLSVVDLDKDGLLDYTEFKAMMTTDDNSPDCRQQ